MSTKLCRRNSSFHKINEFYLPKVNLLEDYEVLQTLGEGWCSRVYLVEHHGTQSEVVLKAVLKDAATRREFFREFHYSYFLSPHQSILKCYDVAFDSGDSYVFAQEFAPFGDLTSNIRSTGLGENSAKTVANQISSALEFMHSKELVHRDIRLDNILLFEGDVSRVKLCDFGSTRRVGELVRKRHVWLPYVPPEICDAVYNEGYYTDPAQDVWQLAVVIFVLLTGSVPWQRADLTDPKYNEFVQWQKRKTTRIPSRFINFSQRLLRLFRRVFDPKPETRASVREFSKYLSDKWLLRPPQKLEMENESLCYSARSNVSCQEEKDKLLATLLTFGVETTVDRAAKRERIQDWILSTDSADQEK